MKIKYVILSLGISIGGYFLLNSKVETITKEEFIKQQAYKRFKQVNFSHSQKIMDEKLAQVFREKMFKEKITSEEIQRDPTLIKKASDLLNEKGILKAEGEFNGNKVNFLITEAKKCKLKLGDELVVVNKNDLSKICNLEFQNLFSSVENLTLKLKYHAANELSDELAEDLTRVNNDLIEQIAIERAYNRFLNKKI